MPEEIPGKFFFFIKYVVFLQSRKLAGFNSKSKFLNKKSKTSGYLKL